MFELAMAAMAANQDLQPQLGQQNPDVEFMFHGRRVLMECKRVFSEKKVLAKVSEAIRQLERCVELGTTDVGVVAVSISRLAHRGDGYWVTSTLDVGRTHLAKALRGMVAELDPLLCKLRSASVAGILFYVSGPMYAQDAGFTVVAEGILYPMVLEEVGLLQQLASTLRV